jgi:uncharacterized phage-associated protein
MPSNEHTYRNFKQANFKSIESNLYKNNWKTIFKEMSVNQVADYLQNVLLGLINQYVPTRVFRKTNFLGT